MSGAIFPLPQYAFMAWCSVRSTGTTLPLLLPGWNHVSDIRYRDKFFIVFISCSMGTLK
jgi:hypothetical protein